MCNYKGTHAHTKINDLGTLLGPFQILSRQEQSALQLMMLMTPDLSILARLASTLGCATTNAHKHTLHANIYADTAELLGLFEAQGGHGTVSLGAAQRTL